MNNASPRFPRALSPRPALAQLLARRGFELRRHPASRRQAMFVSHGVDLVIDVGAARGGYGDELRSFGYAGDIVSFEPLAAAYGDLSAHVAADPRWEARQRALGSAAGRATIHVASNSDSSSLLPMLQAHTDAAPDIVFTTQEDVAVSRLDDEFDEQALTGRRPFLKIDAQGFEGEVLSGGARTLEACVGLQLELSFTRLYEGSPLVHDMLALVHDRGFVLCGFQQGFASPGGQVLQADGIFFRLDERG